MRFLTSQPIEVARILEERDYSASPYTNGGGLNYKPILKKFGYQPIFMIPMIDKVDFIIRYIFTSASCPEVNIIFETEEYDVISAEKWYQYLGRYSTKDEYLDIIADENDEKEYLTSIINRANVLSKVHTVNKTDNLKNDSKMMVLDNEYWKMINNFFDDKRDIFKLILCDKFGESLNQLQSDTINNMVRTCRPYNEIIRRFRENVNKIVKEIY